MDGGRVGHEDTDLGVGDAKLRVRRLGLRDGAGTGRAPVVFLHDSLGCITAWRDFPQRLCEASGRDGLVYDREGYGRSSPLRAARSLSYLHEQADVLGDVLRRCGVQRAALFGHSDGGTIALLAAARHGEAVGAVVTVGAHAFVEEETLGGLRHALAWWNDQEFRRRMARHHGDKAETVFRVWTETWLSPAFRGWDITGELAGVRCPTLVIQGEHDEYASAAHVRTIVGAVGGPGEGSVLPDAGHSPHREDGRVLEATVRFLAGAERLDDERGR